MILYIEIKKNEIEKHEIEKENKYSYLNGN